ncbi:MAG: PorV/PorQ family protein [Candidatus Zixiibacteriota bacterium]
MFKYFLIVILMLLLMATMVAAEGDGGYAGSFLQVPIGARPTAMGGAYRAVSDDGAGVLFNPAGLANLPKKLFGTSYRAMQLDRKMGYVTVLFPAKNQATIGAHWLYAGSGSVAMRDVNGRKIGEDFSQNNHAFSVLFAKRFESYLSVGVKLNYYLATIPEVTANSIGIDLGFMLYVDQLLDREKREELPVKDIQVGLTVKNLGMKYPWNSEKFNQVYSSDTRGYEQDDKVPIEVGLGAAARFIKKKLLVAVDVLKNEEQSAEFHSGAEYFLKPEFALRAGFGDKRFTVGTGYVFNIGRQALAIDYAFSTDKADEGSEHIFSFDLLF